MDTVSIIQGLGCDPAGSKYRTTTNHGHKKMKCGNEKKSEY